MNLAIIPARGGSKSILKKNLALVGSRSLLQRSILCAKQAGIESIFVSTDDHEIAREAIRFGAEVISRPSALSGDNSSSESALIHAISEISRKVETSNSNIAFLQATSPFTSPKDLEIALGNLAQETSIFAAVQFHNFLWVENRGDWLPKDHDSSYRKMREELAHTAMETGNFYCFPVKMFLEQQTRFCGKAVPFFVSPLTTLQVDSPEELMAAQLLAPFFDFD